MPRRRTLITTTATALTLLLSGLGATAARADGSAPPDLFVDPSAATCSDAGSGTQAAPYCSIQAAADATVPGQTVQISGVPDYTEPVVITHSGTPGHPITFTRMNKYIHGATLTGSAAPLVTIRGAQYVDLREFDFEPNKNTAVRINASSHVTIDHSYFSPEFATVATDPAADAVEIDGSSADVTVSRSSISRFDRPAVSSLPGASHIVIAADQFSSNSDGAVLADGTADLEVAGDSVYAGGAGPGVEVRGASSGSVENTVVSGGTGGGIVVSGSAKDALHSDYNAVQTTAGPAYIWDGVPYTSAADLFAGTGQGRNDINALGTAAASPIPVEGSPLVDSGDGDAPGETSTDRYRDARVDDPLVKDSGTGPGHVDRGAFELQNPAVLLGYSLNPTTAMATVPVTITASVKNPWGTPLLYRFAFGDGSSSAPSTSPTVTHTYATAGSPSYPLTGLVSGTDPGSLSTPTTWNLAVVPVEDVIDDVSATTDPAAPDSATVVPYGSSVYGVSDDVLTFGDGSAAVHPQGETSSVPHTFPHPGTYTLTNTVTDTHGRTATVSRPVTVGASFVPVAAPQRILDTRRGIGAAARKVGPGGVLRLKVAGRGGVPGTGVTAVTMSLTDTDATADSYVSAYPDGGSRPTVSNLNFRAGQTNPNLVTVTVGADGYVDLYNRAGTVDLVADVQGYFTIASGNSPGTLSDLITATPRRVLDTGAGLGSAKQAVGPAGRVTFKVGVPDGGPSGPTAVLLNVTAVGGTAPSYVAVDSAGSHSTPTTSVIDLRAGQTTSNLVVAPIDANGSVTLYNSAGKVNLIADVQGFYFHRTSYHSYVPLSPTRILDTRYGIGARAGAVGPNGTVRVKVAGVNGLPDLVSAVLVNLTGVGPSARTYLTAFAGGSVPGTSNLNLLPGETRPVLTAVPVDAEGYITVYNAQGSTDVIVDLEGFTGADRSGGTVG